MRKKVDQNTLSCGDVFLISVVSLTYGIAVYLWFLWVAQHGAK